MPPPEELEDVLDPPGGDARQAHLDDGFLIERRVERLLDGLPHQIPYVLAQRLLVD